MSFIAAAEIVGRVRELLEDGVGTLRRLSSGTFTGDLPPGLDPVAEGVRTLTGARANAEIKRLVRSAATPPVNSNTAIYDVELEVRILRLITPLAQLDDDSRDAIIALALLDGDKVAQVLGFPGNMAGTSALVDAVGGVYPTGFTGGETLIFSFTSAAGATIGPVTVTFTSADQSILEVADRIGTAMESASTGSADGLALTLVGQLRIRTLNGGTGAFISVSGGTGAARIGLSGASDIGASCSLASNVLRYLESTSATVGEVDDGAQELETIHRFSGVAIASPATS